MIKRELYMERIRPFISKDVVKVITGLRRSGKSVMLDLLREEIDDPKHSIYFNFESKKNTKYTNPDTLYDYVIKKADDSSVNISLYQTQEM